MAKNPTEVRRIKDAMFTYHEVIPNPVDPNGEDALIERIGYHGQEVNLLPHDVARGEKHDAFFTDDEPQSGPGAQYPSQFTHDDLVRWLRDVQPNVQQVTGLVNEDPDPVTAAEKMIAAEEEATGGDPRTSLIVGLESIKQGGEQEKREQGEGAEQE